jgi:tyrosyl-tRNA synthetase
MGKTAGGAVWLDPNKFSPYQYYQYWINVDDKDVEKFINIYTFVEDFSLDDIKKAKELLAFEATKIVHGDAEAIKAQTASRALFSGDGANLEGIPTFTLDKSKIEQGLNVLDLLKDSNFMSSKGEAKRTIEGGGLYINNERISEICYIVTSKDIKDDIILIRSGKKKYLKICF